MRAVLTVSCGPQRVIKRYTVLLGQGRGDAVHVRAAVTPRRRPTVRG